MVHNIFLCGYAAQTTSPLSLGTADSYGIEQLQVTVGDGWEGLAVTATFHPPAGEPIRLLVPMDGLLDVPPEATKSAGRLAHGRIVFAGTAEGVQRISCNVSYSLLPHAEINGSDSTATPGMDAQVLAAVAAARAEMEQLRDEGVNAQMQPLTFTGAVSAEYDGSQPVTVEVPQPTWESLPDKPFYAETVRNEVIAVYVPLSANAGVMMGIITYGNAVCVVSKPPVAENNYRMRIWNASDEQDVVECDAIITVSGMNSSLAIKPTEKFALNCGTVTASLTVDSGGLCSLSLSGVAKSALANYRFTLIRVNIEETIVRLDEKYMPTLTSPGGKKFRLIVDDTGALTATPI